jgi:opacity protein-like surface antigen
VGISYTVVSHLELGVVYKFTGTTDHDWTDSGVSLKTDGTMTQSIMATVTYRF